MKQQNLEDLFKSLDHLLERKERVLVAIDGYSSSGKSTLAALLQQKFDCNLFHMDDFFLREEQRTPERYKQPGGNVDYERFLDEILLPLLRNQPFEYRPFNCQTMNFGETVLVLPKKLNIVEGSYSQHPEFHAFYNLRIFLDITPEDQSKRILQRNGSFMHKRFIEEWIPMENRYFETYRIKENSQYILSL